MAEAAACSRFKAYLQDQVDQVNATLPRAWGIKKFVLLPDELSIEGGELTPTMKLKRRVIYAKYAKEIEMLYAA
jgi:long-subunit acyl-CoA synthetase (AMP-forming)